jgi:hypothetical protein
MAIQILTDPIYSNCDDYTKIKNILFIDDTVDDTNIFVDAANETTLTIIYSFNTDRDKINTFIRFNFTSLDRLAFVFHGFASESQNVNVRFINYEYFFTSDDLLTTTTTYSDNITFLKNLITDLNVKHIDYLGCNLLTFTNWETYFNIIKKDSNVNVGASNDNTGNIKYGGDWVLESTMEDISTIYFTSLIDAYTKLLATFTYPYNGVYITFYVTSFNSPYYASVYSCDTSITGILDLNVSPVSMYGDTYTIVGVSNFAFSGCYQLTSLIMPDTITSLGSYIMYNANSGNTSVTLSAGIPYIPINCFNFSQNLKSIIIPESITRLDPFAFANCDNLININIYKNSIEYYYTGTFSSTDRTSIINDFITSPSVDLALWSVVSNICFVEDTLIETDQGLIKIAKINPDIHTINNEKIVCVTKVISTNNKFLIRIKKNALGDNIPSVDTYVSKFHKVLYDDKMICAFNLVNLIPDGNVIKVKNNHKFLYNILMEKHTTMFANNLIVETLHPGNKVALIYTNKIKKCINFSVNTGIKTTQLAF